MARPTGAIAGFPWTRVKNESGINGRLTKCEARPALPRKWRSTSGALVCSVRRGKFTFARPLAREDLLSPKRFIGRTTPHSWNIALNKFRYFHAKKAFLSPSLSASLLSSSRFLSSPFPSFFLSPFLSLSLCFFLVVLALQIRRVSY